MSNEQTNENEKPAASNEPTHNSRHKVRCIAHTFGEASTGTPQIGVLCEVTEGDCKGYMCTWYGSITKAAAEYTVRGMRALGFTGIDITRCESMYTGEALATFEHDENQDGEKRVRISFINGIGVVMKKTYEGADLARFAQNMKALLSQTAGGAAAGAQPLPPMQGQQPQGNQQRDHYSAAPRSGSNGAAPPPWGDDAPPPAEPRGGQQRRDRW